MATVTGVVEAYGEKYGKYSLSVNGTWYSTKQEWYKGPDVKTLKGQTVSFDDGGGKFIKGKVTTSGGSVPSGGGAAAPASSAAPAVGFPIAPLDKQRSIIRQNSLAHAVNIITTVGFTKSKATDPAELAKQAVEIAPIFEAYSAGDSIREKVEAGMKASEEAMSAEEPADDNPF